MQYNEGIKIILHYFSSKQYFYCARMYAINIYLIKVRAYIRGY